MNKKAILFISIYTLLALNAEAKVELNNNECFGRLQYSTPGNIEYAVAVESSLTNGSYPKKDVALFSNGFRSYWSNMNYDQFTIFTTTDNLERTPEAIRSRYFLKGKERHDYFYKYSITKKEIEFGKLVKWFGADKDKAFGTSEPTFIEFIFYNKNFYYFSKGINGNKELYEENDRLPLVADYKQIAENFRRRELNEIPTEVGTCIPYGFIRDDGQVPLNFQTTFRLRDHPEVEVSIFEETERGKKEASITQAQEHAALVWHTDMFFESHYYWTTDLSRGFIFNRYHSLTMNGKNAVWSKGNFTAPNGGKNIAFIAAVLGDQNNPHIEVAVVRYGSSAIGTPMSDEEVIDLGKRIAESVRVRPTSNAPTPPYPNYFEPVQ